MRGGVYVGGTVTLLFLVYSTGVLSFLGGFNVIIRSIGGGNVNVYRGPLHQK